MFLFLITAFNYGSYIYIAFVGYYALGVVVQFFLGGLNIRFYMRQHVRAQFKLFQHLFIPFKNFDCIPSLLLVGKIMHSRLLYMSYGVLNGAVKAMLGHGFSILSRLNRRLGRFHYSCALKGGYFNHLATKLSGQLLNIY